MSESVACPYCREPIAATALKCQHCLEFLPTAAAKKADANARPLAQEGIALIGKAFIPVAILILAFAFKPTIDSVLRRTSHAEFLGTKLIFEETKSFSGSLTPTELFYLIGAAQGYGRTDFGNAWNLDVLESTGRIRAIDSLKDKGLLETRINDNFAAATARAYGKRSISMKPTEKGKDFLIELGLKFNGTSFVDAP